MRIYLKTIKIKVVKRLTGLLEKQLCNGFVIPVIDIRNSTIFIGTGLAIGSVRTREKWIIRQNETKHIEVGFFNRFSLTFKIMI